MGSGDLNLKKSWNPALMKNREKVWKMEQEMLREHKEKISNDTKLNEIQSKSELLTIHQSSNGKGERDLVGETMDRTRWMYKGPKNEQEASEMANEEYLLGKKKLTGLLGSENDSNKKRSKGNGDRFEKLLSLGAATEKNGVDFEKKRLTLDKSDPLYAIKLQELKKKEMQDKRERLREYKSHESKRKMEYKDDDNYRSNRPKYNKYTEEESRSKYDESKGRIHRSRSEHRSEESQRSHNDSRSGYRQKTSDKSYRSNRDEDPQRYPQNYRNRR